MKFFHLSDLHIGLKLLGRDLMEDQLYILDQIVEAARRERPDAVVVAGDIYDKAVPSAEAVAAFDGFIAALTDAAPRAKLMLISGNHDSGTRLNLFRRVLNRQKIHMIGLPPRLPEERVEVVTLEDAYGPVRFWLLPFVKPSMVRAIVGTDQDGGGLSYEESLRGLIGRETIDATQRNVLVSHQFYVPAGTDAGDVARADSEICTVGNIDAIRADLLAPFDYAALGHLHRPMIVGDDRFRYCGAPLATSVSEAGQQKGIVVVELGAKGDVRTDVLPLVPLRQVRILTGDLNALLAQACGDYVTAVLTDAAGLDALDLRDRLQAAFPNLLEIRREQPRGTDEVPRLEAEAMLDPIALCGAFLGALDADEQALLTEVVNTAREVKDA